MVVLCASFWLSACDQIPPDSDQRIAAGLDAVHAGNHGEAYWHWRNLADAGMAEAQFQLGWLYANGNGLRVNPVTAIQWWEKAAASGHREAEFAIAMAYLNGEPRLLKPDFTKSMQWLISAADHGSDDAKELARRLLRTRSQDILKLQPGVLARSWLGERSRITGGEAIMRESPSKKAAQAGRIANDSAVTVVDVQGDWRLVVRPDQTGLAWVAGKALEPAPRAKP